MGESIYPDMAIFYSLLVKKHPNSTELTELLVSQPNTIIGQFVLASACRAGNVDRVRILLQSGKVDPISLNNAPIINAYAFGEPSRRKYYNRDRPLNYK